MHQNFEDRSSARGQGPTKDLSDFGTVAKGSGKDVGGRANLRAEGKWITADGGRPVKNPGTSGGIAKQTFKDHTV